jgi:hypothetical protein
MIAQYIVTPSEKIDQVYWWRYDTESKAVAAAQKLANETRVNVMVSKVIGYYDCRPRYVEADNV